ncbi:MAG TPA: FtsX-like permease family protein, partial [Candidatus Bathyarchaeia archaeon]|nr:FtsX-like permease family protein [Candidatus Bathyarchaeia archaeon]
LNGMSAGNMAFGVKQFNSLAPNVMFVSSGQHGFHGPSGPPTIIINSQVVKRIKALPYVQDTVPAYRGQLQLNAQGSIQNVPVIAMDTSKISLILPTLQLVPGSAIKPTDPTAMVVGNTVANPPGAAVPFLSIGQTVKATSTYSTGASGKAATESKTFVVSGILESSGNNYVDQAIVINEIVGNQLFHKTGKYDSITVAASSPVYVNTVAKEITDLYGPNNLSVITPTAIIQTQQQLQSGTATFALMIAFIALLVGSVGIITTLYTSVNDRVSEIGTMKAIGAKSTFIMALFMSEAFLIGILGATSGLLIGIAGGYALSGMVPHSASGPGGGGGSAHADPIFVPSDLLRVWSLSLLLSIAAGIMPAWKASRLSPLEALRK